MPYYRDIPSLAGELSVWLDLRREQGGRADAAAAKALRCLRGLVREVQRLPVDPKLVAREPDGLAAIRSLRPAGPRVLRVRKSDADLRDRLLGAWLGRAAGCMLGIPCEGMTRDQIAAACEALGQKHPLEDYWALDPKPGSSRNRQYGVTPRTGMLRPGMNRAGADDDLAYTLLGLLILEDYGIDFTPAQVGEAWLKYLPIACTAERVALDNLRRGLRPPRTARVNNPYAEWIGADIRSDPWGYAAAGCPEAAAGFAWRDAVVSHTRNGIYGEMYFSAVLAAALVVDDIGEALRIGLSEIPRDCRMAQTVRQTLAWCRRLNYDETIRRIEKTYAGMSNVHTLNNAALTLAGLTHGRGDLGRTIGLTVIAGLDTDCTGATAGSIVGATLGARHLPPRWTRPLGSYAETYLIGHGRFAHRDVAGRFLRIARQVRRAAGI
jgi:ADP-ribosylglycohydrolase